jgi:hypothetical protein
VVYNSTIREDYIAIDTVKGYFCPSLPAITIS